MAFFHKSDDAKGLRGACWLSAAAVCGLLFAGAGLHWAPVGAAGTTAEAAQSGDNSAESSSAGSAAETAPEFTEEFLTDPKVLERGKAIWDDQCRHCHGRAAYPGKAPRLDPDDLTPEFAYDRVTNGYKKMPGWDDVYSQEERMSVVAYLLSPSFSP
jgi:mono/diheme cytochrome c family protein